MVRRAVFFGLMALVAAPLTAAAQRPQVSVNDDWCRQDGGNDRRARVCEVRDFEVTAAGVLTVDAEPNGGIEVDGSPRNSVLVRAKVSAEADTPERARQIADAVTVNASASNVSATGPSGLGRREQWHVSYRLAVPTISSLSLKSTNGGIAIRDVDGDVEFKTVNGGVKLVNLAGDVKGRTSNGGVDVDLDGPGWRGAGLNVETSNGGVHLRIPEQYSAQLETGTVNGGFNIDFPITVRGRVDREITATLGAGGAPIRVRTHNGGVKVSKK
jgi:DUF4097 and DUF4098 domain-containing protein YvlB